MNTPSPSPRTAHPGMTHSLRESRGVLFTGRTCDVFSDAFVIAFITACFVLGVLCSGCVCVYDVPPGATVTVSQNIGWRSSQGVATNLSNHVASGADFQIPLTGK
jgi:hypothetical protein